MATTVGIVGTGRMGTAMCKRLIETGHGVTVWNRTASKTADCAAAGASVAKSLAELAGRADIVITSLTDAPALSEVYTGPDGLLAQTVDGKLFVEMSTILPDDEKKLAEAVRAKGAGFVECPVGGTVGPALKGQLLGLAGGSAADFERARPMLEALCKRVELLGEVGAGSSMKLAVNLPLAIYWQTLGEALHMVDGLALDGARFVSIIADSSAGPNVLKNRADVVAQTIDGSDQPGTFDINGLYKDLRLALAWGKAKGRVLPMSAEAAKSYEAAIKEGLGGFDGSTLTRFIRSL